jgi:hypothetical protein
MAVHAFVADEVGPPYVRDRLEQAILSLEPASWKQFMLHPQD